MAVSMNSGLCQVSDTTTLQLQLAEERPIKSHLGHEVMNKGKTKQFIRNQDSHIRTTNTFEIMSVNLLR